MSCCPLPSSSARSPANASATRSPPRKRKAGGWEACRRSATGWRIASWSSSPARPRPCGTSSAAMSRSVRCGCCSRSWTSSSGRQWGGKPIARGALYLLLQNRIYRGEIVHKEHHYPGEHQAIIDPEAWGAAHAKLAANAVERSTRTGARSPSLLAGLLFDADGNRMTPTHAVKNGRRYPYYVSHPLITGARAISPSGMRGPAAEIEQLVTERIPHLFA